MQKRLLTNLLLLLVVGILMTFFILSDKQGADNQKVLLSNIETASISRITINRVNSEDIAFQKQGDRWFMTSPLKARTNMARINAMLHLLRSSSFAQIDVKNSSLTPYQLDAAAIVLHLDNHEFLFGVTDPLDERRYVMFNNTIHLINDSLFPQLGQSPMFFVSTRLIPDEEIINSIEFTDHLVTKVNQSWSLSPVNDAVSAEQLNALTSAWQTGEARQVRQYSTVDVREKVVVKFSSGRSAQFDIVTKSPNLVLGRSDLALQYYLGKGVAEALLVPQTNTNEEK